MKGARCIHNNQFTDRTNEVAISNQGLSLKIVSYRNALDIDVLVDDKYISEHTSYYHFKHGSVSSPYHLSVYGAGFLGEGKYITRNNHRQTKAYRTWNSMLERCYSENKIYKCPTYVDCFVDESWHNFQIFAEWYHENYYSCDDERMCLDKDILFKGNKIYCPEKCILVPIRINSLFIKSNAARGDCPIGVSYQKSSNKYVAAISKIEQATTLGRFSSVNEAFEKYKTEKEKYIKLVADEYRSKYKDFPQRLYDAMYEYEVDIND